MSFGDIIYLTNNDLEVEEMTATSTSVEGAYMGLDGVWRDNDTHEPLAPALSEAVTEAFGDSILGIALAAGRRRVGSG